MQKATNYPTIQFDGRAAPHVRLSSHQPSARSSLNKIAGGVTFSGDADSLSQPYHAPAQAPDQHLSPALLRTLGPVSITATPTRQSYSKQRRGPQPHRSTQCRATFLGAEPIVDEPRRRRRRSLRLSTQAFRWRCPLSGGGPALSECSGPSDPCRKCHIAQPPIEEDLLSSLSGNESDGRAPSPLRTSLWLCHTAVSQSSIFGLARII